MHDIILDERIRNYALIPIFLLTLLTGIIRVSLAPQPPSDSATSNDLEKIKKSNDKMRYQFLKMNCPLLSASSSAGKQKYFSSLPSSSSNSYEFPGNPMLASLLNPDPEKLPTMLKTQMMSFLPQGCLMYIINNLFTGFLVAKIPFQLTFSFKTMLQRGIDVPSLDISYVSSLSWYFFCLLGLNGFLMFIKFLIDTATHKVDVRKFTQGDIPSMMPAMGFFGGAQKFGGPSSADGSGESEFPKFTYPGFALKNVEEKLLEVWEKKQ